MATYAGNYLWNTLDRSGKIEVKLYEARTTTNKAQWHDETIIVPEDSVVIGGGVEIQPRPAFITASYPNKDLSGWVASSKDHEISCPHGLRLYALGMRITGLSRSQLFNLIRIHITNSPVTSHPEVEANVTQGYVILGGGIRIDYQGAGSLATASFPSSPRSTWKARAKDHHLPCPASVFSYAIGIAQELPVGKVVGVTNRSTSVRTSWPSATVALKDGYALTGGGGEAVYGGAGSLLCALRPDWYAGDRSDKTGFHAESHDHIDADPSQMRAFALGIRIK
jgi:hypothetical protein